MLTFTDMKNNAADNCGVYPTDPAMKKIIRDINTGVKRFQNAARRYWTRREKKTNLVLDQVYYQFPSDMLRVTTVKAVIDGTDYPLTQINGEDEWIRLNSVKTSSGIPTAYYIKGADEIGIYPTPSGNITDGLVVSYEPRMVDMSIEDVEVTCTLTENSYIIEATNGTFSPKMVNDCWITVEDGSDGNWYKVSKYIDSTHIWIDNVYQGASATGVEVRIGQVPQFPEEYHDAPVDYACALFFKLRKDLETSGIYQQSFDKAFAEYRTVYGIKTTGALINPTRKPVSRVPSAWPGTLRDS